VTKVLNPNRRYVVGFIFDSSHENVLLIRKKRPAWQAGKLNGIGGEIESGETPHGAMVRECAEECSLMTDASDWRLFISLQDQRGWWIDFFYTTRGRIGDARSATDEDVEIVPAARLDGCITNLRGLIPMALTMADETCKGFESKVATERRDADAAEDARWRDAIKMRIAEIKEHQ